MKKGPILEAKQQYRKNASTNLLQKNRHWIFTLNARKVSIPKEGSFFVCLFFKNPPCRVLAESPALTLKAAEDAAFWRWFCFLTDAVRCVAAHGATKIRTPLSVCVSPCDSLMSACGRWWACVCVCMWVRIRKLLVMMTAWNDERLFHFLLFS